jgi:hypothetical protein
MRALEEFAVTVGSFKYNTSGSAEKIKLPVEGSMTRKPKGSTCLTRSSDAFWGNGLCYGDSDEFALFPSLKCIRRLGVVLVLCFHGYQTYFGQPLPFWEILKELEVIDTNSGGKVAVTVRATNTRKSRSSYRMLKTGFESNSVWE